MTTTVEQVDVWRASSAEHENLEFKEARHQFDNDKLFDYCVAIANEGGGVILLGMTYPASRDGVVDRLVRERLVARAGSAFVITNLGALLSAKRLEDFDHLARKAPRVIAYEGTGKLGTKRDQLGVRGYAVGFAGLVQFIM